MLVLTRKKDQSIVIDGRITIKLIRTKGNSVRLGIEAPDDVSIRRGELQPLPGQLSGRLAHDMDAASDDSVESEDGDGLGLAFLVM